MAKQKQEVSQINAKFADWAKQNADKVSEEEAQSLLPEFIGVLQDRRSEARSRESLGVRLNKIREILEPKRIFQSSIKYFFNMSKATAYRYMELAEMGRKILPAPVFEAAIERGTPIRKDVIAQMPPPKTDNPETIAQYLQKLEEQPQRRPNVQLEADPDLLTKEVVNFFGARIERLKANGADTRSLKAFTKRVASMILTKGGIEDELKLVPVAIPESYIVHRGAPRKSEQPEPKAA